MSKKQDEEGMTPTEELEEKIAKFRREEPDYEGVLGLQYAVDASKVAELLNYTCSRPEFVRAGFSRSRLRDVDWVVFSVSVRFGKRKGKRKFGMIQPMTPEQSSKIH